MYQLGQTIGEELERNLRATIGKRDYSTVSKITGVGMSTIRDVVYAKNPLTLSNTEGLKELISEGIRNCEQKLLDVEQTIIYLEESYNQIEEFILTERGKVEVLNGIEINE
jgi:hypothetical protein